MIICDDVSKFILRNVDLHIPKGSVVGIIGASGSGKTTFLKLAAGLFVPDRGKIYTCRTNPALRKRKSLQQMAALFADAPVFQDDVPIKYYFDELKTIYDPGTKDYDQRLLDVSRRLGFDKIMNLCPKALSLGQRRRAELGTVMVRNAGLYILDEPCVGLDQSGKACLYDMIRHKKEESATVVLSSHSMEDIASVAERIILLHEGRVAFYGAQAELYKRLAPTYECSLEYEGKIPDISRLETEEYLISNNKMVIRYNSNHVSSKEVLSQIAQDTTIKSVNIRKSGLSECIRKMQIKGGRE